MSASDAHDTPEPPDVLDLPPVIEGEGIAGRVTDPEGVPLAGVRVEAAETGGGDLDLLPVLSDGEGRFHVEGLQPGGRYDLRFSLGTVKARVLAVPTGTADLAARLARPQGILLVIKTEPGLAPPALYQVALTRRTEEGARRAWYGRKLAPRMLLWRIRPGTYTVTVWGGGYLPIEAHGVEVRSGAPAPEIEVALGPEGGTVAGVVQGAANAPIPDALVSWRRLDARGHAPLPMRTTKAGEDGAYAIRGLPEGRYRVVAWSPTAGLGAAEVDVVEGERASADVTVR